MPLYHIKAIDKEGRIREYNKDFPDIARLNEDLRKNGHLLVEFKEKKKKNAQKSNRINQLRSMLQSRTITDEDMYNLFYELGIIMRANVPLINGFRMMIEETRKPAIKNFLQDVLFKLKEGGDFSNILEGYRAVYNFTSYIPIIRRGEKTGKLGESFLTIAQSIDKRIKLRNEITNALIYPMILVGTGFVAVYVMLVYVIPRFEPIVKSFDVVLPFHTRVLFSLSVFLSSHQYAIVISMIILLLLLLILGRNPKFKSSMHQFFNRLPIIRGIKFSSESLHFLNTLSNLLTGGVPILSALNLASEGFTSPSVRKQMTDVAQSLRQGQSLADALKDTGLFPEIIPNMVRVGEESGTLPEVLNQLHDFMSERFLKKTRKFMNLLEPLIIIFIALFVGLLIMSIIPILMNISDAKF